MSVMCFNVCIILMSLFRIIFSFSPLAVLTFIYGQLLKTVVHFRLTEESSMFKIRRSMFSLPFGFSTPSHDTQLCNHLRLIQSAVQQTTMNMHLPDITGIGGTVINFALENG